MITFTSDDLNNYLVNSRHSISFTVPGILCQDGFRMSIQASINHYCLPKCNLGPWQEVEIGFPSHIEPLLWQWAENKYEWLDTVYSYVPIHIAALVIELHGGIKCPLTQRV